MADVLASVIPVIDGKLTLAAARYATLLPDSFRISDATNKGSRNYPTQSAFRPTRLDTPLT